MLDGWHSDDEARGKEAGQTELKIQTAGFAGSYNFPRKLETLRAKSTAGGLVTDITQDPKRKRRRWIIAGTLLSVVAAADWWHWPRGDARFVGRWRISGGDAVCMLELSGNGSGRVMREYGEANDFRWTNHCRWRVINERLEIEDGLPPWLRRASRSLPTAVQRLLGLDVPSIAGSYTLFRRARDECVVTPRRSHFSLMMKRIPMSAPAGRAEPE